MKTKERTASDSLDLQVANNNRSPARVREPLNRSRLNTADFEARMSHYPEEIKPAALWLHFFIHNKCNGHHTVASRQLRKLGFQVSDNYVYQIVTGAYFRGKVGKTAISNFTEMAEALRKHDQLANASGKIPFIETGTYQRIADYIDLKRAPDTVCKFGMIAGDTGLQKTESIKHYETLNNHGAVIRIEAPAMATLPRFLVKLGHRYGVGITAGTASRMVEVERCVNETRTIIVDNAQRLYLPNAGRAQPIFSFLQELQDDTGCTIILSVTNEFPDTMTDGKDKDFFHQFAGRIGGVDKILRLPEYPPKADIIQIAEAFKVADIKAGLPTLIRWSRGKEKIRVLFDRLQDARRLANSEDSETITLDHLEAS